MRLALLLFFACLLHPQLQASKLIASSLGFDPIDATSSFQQAINSPVDTVIIDKQAFPWRIGPSDFFDL
ncbi:MAG: hypothetical protein AAF206_10715, partial [Bacteroidota bacterium]